MARTDARGVLGFDEAVRRARLYLDAGADAIFPEALESESEFEVFAKAVPAPDMARLPRCAMCQSVALPSTAEYWHIGETMMRLASSSLPIFTGENKCD